MLRRKKSIPLSITDELAAGAIAKTLLSPRPEHPMKPFEACWLFCIYKVEEAGIWKRIRGSVTEIRLTHEPLIIQQMYEKGKIERVMNVIIRKKVFYAVLLEMT